jgi:gliding motility-associated-like protein
VDASGNVYVADFYNNAVKKIPFGNGAVVTVATGFNGPYGIAIDATGNLYVSDFNNNEVKKIPTGSSTPAVIGSGFASPTGVAVDASGNVYVADRGNNAIKKILTSNGSTVTLSAGSGNPDGVAVDAAGNVYFADTNLASITEIPIAGGNNIAVGSGFVTPTCVVVDTKGDIFIGDNGNGVVKEVAFGGYKISPTLPAGLSFNMGTGVISGTPTAATAAANYTVTATNSGGSGTAVINITVNLPAKPIISYSTPQVYIATEAITPLSPVSTGGPIPPTGAFSVSPALPSGLSMDVNTGTVSGTPTGASPATNYTITATNAGGGGTAVVSIAVNLPAKPAISYSSPQVYTTTEAINSLFPNSTGGPIPSSGAFSVSPALPAGLSLNVNTGAISGTPTVSSPAINYTVTATNAGGSGTAIINITVNPYPGPIISYNTPQSYPLGFAIIPLSPSSNGVGAAGSSNITSVGSGFSNSTGVAVDAAGNVYEADNGSSTIKEIPVNGGPVLTLGSGFNHPAGVAVDASGNVYVTDFYNNAVKKIPSGNGAVATIATGFNGPYGIAIDVTGNLYVSDFNNNEVKKIPAGNGTPVVIGSGFANPAGVAVDASGNVYVADRGHNAIKEILASNGTTILIASGSGNPNGVAVDVSGNVYFADTNNTSMEEIHVGSLAITSVGSGFVTPTAVATGVADSNIIYVDSNGNGIIYKVTPTGGFFISPALPAGLALSSSTGAISGTPTVVSPAANYKVTAYNVGGSGSAIVNISVYNTNAGLASLATSSGTLSPVFSTAVTSYTVSEANTTSTITVTPMASQSSNTITVNGVAVASGSPSKPISLTVGSNAISIIVKSSAGQIIGNYTITANRLPSSNDNLASMTISAGVLSPAFSSAVTSYKAFVSDAITTFSVTPVVTDSTATVTVDNQAVASGSVSTPVPLSEGTNTVSVAVTAQNGTTTQTYSISVFRGASTNDNLSALKISAGTLTPAFSGTTISYTANVGNAVASITVTPTAADATATVTVNGTAVTSGTSSSAIPLMVGSNIIAMVVTAQDGTTTKTYSVTITRAPSTNAYLLYLSVQTATLSPSFAYKTFAYTSNVPNATSSVTVTPSVLDLTATAKVNGATVANKAASGTIPLSVGANTITVVITAQDGVTTQTYTITISRAPSTNDNLSALSISAGTLTPSFASETTSYSAGVTNAVSSITITPTTSDPAATVKVNGTTVASGSASAAIPLNIGANTITVMVTAQDGATTKNYAVTVTRALSGNDNLSALKISNGTLTPAFATSTATYTVSVGNGVTSLTVTPTTADPTATVKVNGIAVTSGTASGAIALNVGANTITTVVTAQNGTSTQTYLVTVTRAPSTNAYLLYLSVQTATLSPTFAYKTFGYSSNVHNTTSSVTVTPSVLDLTAMVKVNGTPVTNKTASGPIALAVGANTITVLVTAQDGVTTQTYTLTITRAVTGADSFVPITIGTGISVIQSTQTPVLADDGIMVHQGVSPNGDGINDFLQIDNITQYPDNKLAIMNRNGQLVYETQGYDNTSKVFDGHSNKNGQMQQPGTYFYQLDYTINGITKHKTGFLVLKY